VQSTGNDEGALHMSRDKSFGEVQTIALLSVSGAFIAVNVSGAPPQNAASAISAEKKLVRKFLQ